MHGAQFRHAGGSCLFRSSGGPSDRHGVALVGRQLQHVETQLAGRSEQSEPAALCRAGRLVRGAGQRILDRASQIVGYLFQQRATQLDPFYLLLPFVEQIAIGAHQHPQRAQQDRTQRSCQEHFDQGKPPSAAIAASGQKEAFCTTWPGLSETENESRRDSSTWPNVSATKPCGSERRGTRHASVRPHGNSLSVWLPGGVGPRLGT